MRLVIIAENTARAKAYREAKGADIVAFLDPRYQPGSLWRQAVEASQETVGGRVLPGPNYTWSAWLYYVVEYGWRHQLVAGNVAYHAATTHQIDELNPGDGRLDERMDVQLITTPTLKNYLQERFRYSQQWGARYVSKTAAILRIALPLLMLQRTPWWRKPATLPGVLLIGCIAAAGEIHGSLFPRSVTLKS